MDRRSFFWLLGAGTSAAALSAFAQPAGKLRKIGILNALPREAPLPQVFLRGLRDLGYVEGKNIIVEYRSGPYSDFPALAGELDHAQMERGLRRDVEEELEEEARLKHAAAKGAVKPA
jgi:putative tryptophan/tyrosine transport system substrate-binding protein